MTLASDAHDREVLLHAVHLSVQGLCVQDGISWVSVLVKSQLTQACVEP